MPRRAKYVEELPLEDVLLDLLRCHCDLGAQRFQRAGRPVETLELLAAPVGQLQTVRSSAQQLGRHRVRVELQPGAVLEQPGNTIISIRHQGQELLAP